MKFIMTTKRMAGIMLVAMLCAALPALAQQSVAKNSATVKKGPIVIEDYKHDAGPMLREIAPLLPEFSLPSEREIVNNVNPNHHWSNKVQKDAVLQTEENSPTLQTPTFNLEFDGAGFGDDFFCDCMPPDNNGAAGTTQYVQYINLEYQVFDKSGNTVLGPLAGNSFWTGFGGSCESDNSGDPIVRFDAAAQRWVVSQFAINDSGNDFECVAVSKTADATGAYNRYAYSFAMFPDYPKMSVWPDAYYFTFNNFNLAGTAYVGASACAVNRTKMLTGAAAPMQCFVLDSNQYGLLPSDLDGPTAPAAGTPNFVMELDPSGSANLDLFKFHVDFTTPANSTFTGPTLIPVAAFTPLCNLEFRGQCVPQPAVGSDLLESLGDRLMFRLVYRNFGDHTTLLTTHSIASGTGGGVRWYEIRNPETTPTVFQSGTFAPDSKFRWIPSIAMDRNQDIAVAYSRSGSGATAFPSLVYAGRVPSDPAGKLETEVVMKAGAGSQTGNNDRWGDYSSLTIDPTDDCTFWFTQEYEKADGGFNWSTAIGTFVFPGCNASPDFSLTSSGDVTITQGNHGTSTITVVPVDGFSGSATLSATGLPTGVTAGFSPNPTATTSTLTLTASATATTGTVTVTIKGVSGSLTHTTTLSLTVNPTATKDFSLTAAPTSVTITQGNNGASTITVNPVGGFTGNVTLSVTGLPAGVTKAFSPNPTASASTLTLTASATATTGTVTLTIKGVSGSLNHTTTLGLTVNASGGSPAVTLSPTSLIMGSVVVGATSAAKLVTLTNSGTGTLNISNIATSGDFALSTTTMPCGSTLAAGKKCKIGVTFTPTQTGARTGNLTITDNASGSPQTVALSGTGIVAATLMPTTVTFPATTVGSTGAAKVLTLTNKQTVALNSIAISTTGDFNVSSTTCGASLAAKGTCTINVTFKPTAKGTRTGTAKVTDNANNSPRTSSLTGTGK